MKCVALIASALFLLCNAAHGGDVAENAIAQRACAAIAGRVDAVAGSAPVFLRSYDDGRGAGEVDDPALRTAAFTYDNALAVIALLACDKRAQALRVGEALRLAAINDTRLRNTYRAGAVGDKVLPNGWWDAKQNHWVENAYQDGSATGNVAWAALALLALHDATGDARWRDAAVKLADWVIANASDSRGAGGFTGGIDGFDANPKKVIWKSTEHNVDLVAAFDWLAKSQAPGEWKKYAGAARHFVESQWDAASGHFLVGTLADGVTPNRGTSGLDVQMWAQLLPDAPREWQRAIAYAEREHRVAGGFDFNSDRDGLWLEGTAQAALVYRQLGREADAQKLFATIAQQFSSGGFVYATREPRITTGLAIGSDSTSADFYYYHRPHLGATAWAALAALNRNPFVGSR
ncbi:MAG TPA: hypothetical protein VIE67_03715 [Rudaea sp.]|uniref:hypothetical protein n=1 Tax=Rudaea sp. TaxID=2136325 RepID=UPI002F94F3B0